MTKWVGLLEAFARPSHPTRRLLEMANRWSKRDGDIDPASREAGYSPTYQSKQQPSLAEQIGEAGVAQLLARYRRGTTQQELADCMR
jgi:hypothetical protein